MKIVIVGGVAGGATAAARIRRLNEHAEIIIFEVNIGYFVINLCHYSKTAKETFGSLKCQIFFIFNNATDIIRQATVCV